MRKLHIVTDAYAQIKKYDESLAIQYTYLQNALHCILFKCGIFSNYLQRKALGNFSYLWGRYAGKFPLYTANVSAIHGNDINATGEFYLNFIEKLLQLELNMTTGMHNSLKYPTFPSQIPSCCPQ